MPDRQESLCVVFCHDEAAEAFDPDPAETARRDIELKVSPPDGVFAAVGWRSAGLRAAELAARRGPDVARLVLCAVPAPTHEDDLGFDVGSIVAKTLLLYGQTDEDAPPSAAEWWKKHLPGGARVEIVPRRGSDFIAGMWGRVISHAAPGSIRRS